VVVGPLGKRISPVYLLGTSSLLFGLIDLLIIDIPIFVPSLLIVGILFVLVGMPGIGMSVGLNSLFQSIVEDKLRGRIFGTLFAVQALMALIGMGLAGALGDRLGSVPMLNIQGSVYTLSGLLVLFTLGRMIKQRNIQQDEEAYSVG
jgi:MFS family permease